MCKKLTLLRNSWTILWILYQFHRRFILTHSFIDKFSFSQKNKSIIWIEFHYFRVPPEHKRAGNNRKFSQLKYISYKLRQLILMFPTERYIVQKSRIQIVKFLDYSRFVSVYNLPESKLPNKNLLITTNKNNSLWQNWCKMWCLTAI